MAYIIREGRKELNDKVKITSGSKNSATVSGETYFFAGRSPEEIKNLQNLEIEEKPQPKQEQQKEVLVAYENPETQQSYFYKGVIPGYLAGQYAKPIIENYKVVGYEDPRTRQSISLQKQREVQNQETFNQRGTVTETKKGTTFLNIFSKNAESIAPLSETNLNKISGFFQEKKQETNPLSYSNEMGFYPSTIKSGETFLYGAGVGFISGSKLFGSPTYFLSTTKNIVFNPIETFKQQKTEFISNPAGSVGEFAGISLFGNVLSKSIFEVAPSINKAVFEYKINNWYQSKVQKGTDFNIETNRGFIDYSSNFERQTQLKPTTETGFDIYTNFETKQAPKLAETGQQARLNEFGVPISSESYLVSRGGSYQKYNIVQPKPSVIIERDIFQKSLYDYPQKAYSKDLSVSFKPVETVRESRSTYMFTSLAPIPITEFKQIDLFSDLWESSPLTFIKSELNPFKSDLSTNIRREANLKMFPIIETKQENIQITETKLIPLLLLQSPQKILQKNLISENTFEFDTKQRQASIQTNSIFPILRARTQERQENIQIPALISLPAFMPETVNILNPPKRQKNIYENNEIFRPPKLPYSNNNMPRAVRVRSNQNLNLSFSPIKLDIVPLADLFSVNVTESATGRKATHPKITKKSKREYSEFIRFGEQIFPTEEIRTGRVKLFKIDL